MSIYCGNNASHPSLMNGKSIIGTRLSCLRKGYGKGINMPYDIQYEGEFTPIDNTKIYCGNNDQLPEGYDRFGSLTDCLSKGIGLGKKAKIQEGKPKIIYKILYWIAFAIIVTSIAITIRFTKPSIIKNNSENIDEVRYSLLIILIAIVTFSIFFYLRTIIFY